FRSFSGEGTVAKLSPLVSELGARVRSSLGITALSPTEKSSSLASIPQNPEATRAYAEGLALLRTFDAKGACEAFEKGVAAEPSSALLHSALAEAWGLLGYDGKAKEQAVKATGLVSGLKREDQLVVEASAS